MISGLVNANLEAVISLTISGTQTETHEIEVVIDTGYNGFLTLPSETVAELGLSHFGRTRVELGDGSLQIFELYLASVLWDGQAQTIVIDAAETAPLAGTSLLVGYDFSARFIPGGHLTLTQVSTPDSEPTNLPV